MATAARKRVTWDRTMLVLGFVVAALGLVVAIGVGLDQHWADEKIIYALNQSLQTTQTALDTSKAEKAAVSSVSLDTFLQQYNDHVAALKSAGEAYEDCEGRQGIRYCRIRCGRRARGRAKQTVRRCRQLHGLCGPLAFGRGDVQ